MSILSTLFDLIFPPTSTSDCGSEKDPLGLGMGSKEMMAINPANGMPMVGGMGGIDLMGNLWGQSDSLDNQDSHCSEVCFSDLFDSGPMLDAGSIFD